jgi:DNA-binding MarR family transcriptional regulator
VEAEKMRSPLTGNAGFLLSRVGAAVQTGFKELLGEWRIRPQHFAILTALSVAGEASQQQLCQALGIDSGNMVEMVDTLETLGYARRRRDPADRRRYLVAMTAEGRLAFAAIRDTVADFTVRFLDPLGQREQTALVGALAKLYAATPEGQRLPPPAAAAGSVRR